MRIVATLLFATLLLTAAARLRPPEYDEAYSIFLTAGDARPAWPTGIFHPGEIRGFYKPHSTPLKIARDLRTGDVHPPLYFWVLEYWRRLFGPGWFAARMLSVLLAISTLATLAWLATLAKIPVTRTMLILLLSYGFAYTGILARGFALAQLLNIIGMSLTYKGARDQKWGFCLTGGMAFGAAGFSNYLAIFIGLAALFWLLSTQANGKSAIPTAIGFALFIPLISYFFMAQRNARIGQFVAFSPLHAGYMMVKDSGAALFGGLPVYAGRGGVVIAAALAILIAICIGFVVQKWQPKLSLFAIAAAATPVGLLALGFIFNNTPIEIRYLAFSLPFLALILAQTLPPTWLVLMLGLEACGIAGLMLAPATMQPQGLVARDLSEFATPTSLVLLPFGNDGVGIPGPFIASAPDDLRLELFKPNDQPNITTEHRVILVTIDVDAASRQATAIALRDFNAESCWVQKSSTQFLKLFVRTCGSALLSH